MYVHTEGEDYTVESIHETPYGSTKDEERIDENGSIQSDDPEHQQRVESDDSNSDDDNDNEEGKGEQPWMISNISSAPLDYPL